jgi:hypothetical protein
VPAAASRMTLVRDRWASVLDRRNLPQRPSNISDSEMVGQNMPDRTWVPARRGPLRKHILKQTQQFVRQQPAVSLNRGEPV